MNSIISGDDYHRIYAKGFSDGVKTILESLKVFVKEAHKDLETTIEKHEQLCKPLTDKEK